MGINGNILSEHLTLCGVTYFYSGGMMRDFDINIHLRDQQIVYACFYPWEGLNDYSGILFHSGTDERNGASHREKIELEDIEQ